MKSKKEDVTYYTVVTGTLFLNSQPFCVSFDPATTHSFISSRCVMQLNLKNRKVINQLLDQLSNDSIVECPISYKLVPITIGGVTLPGDFIQFDLSDFDIILGMN